MKQEIIDDIKKWNWQTVIDFGNSLDDLNDSQWRFLKGLVIELAVEKHSEPTLKYVGQVHRDFEWGKHQINLELKSNMMASIYTKKGEFRSKYSIKLSNSMGTNSRTLDPTDVADIILVPMSDGVFALDKDTVMSNHTAQGDGVSVTVTPDKIIPLTGPMQQQTVYNTKLKEIIMAAITAAIP